MIRCCRKLWLDDAGFVISAELVVIATTLTLAMCVGLAAVQEPLSAAIRANATHDATFPDDPRYESLQPSPVMN